ncbi:phage protein [Bordetella genomosp. 1]|uniref:Bacteriophage protein n=1 Tax=Bordetella genomosp. 1 TaxID=1395607 RepID=A0ABX4EUF3_9BORD|nr:hypothetical protein [Bordetella genomosp. 1]OZI57869.1 hypothetical protein CAL27_20940 [Bordetella genomosp. 1]
MTDPQNAATSGAGASTRETVSVRQWLRKVSLVLAGDEAVELSELHFTFDITQTDNQTPNNALIKVYNVNPELALRAMQEFRQVTLNAGYQGNYGVIFQGSIVQVRMLDEQTNSVLEIRALDGDQAYNFAFVNKTLPAGATMSNVIDEACYAMSARGAVRGYIVPRQDPNLPRAKVMFSLARDVMAAAARSTGSKWNIHNGKINLCEESAYVPGRTILIDAKTGMLGSPTQTEKGLEVRVLLNPSIVAGRLIQLPASSIQMRDHWPASGQDGGKNAAEQRKQITHTAIQPQGFYTVISVLHKGDTRGTAWESRLICASYDITKPDNPAA